jgi:hypothetical protein
MYSGGNTRALPRVGFPIRKSRDQRLVSISPGLIAAAHVLHRLLAPRHPPCALVLLIRKNTCVAAMEFSRCTRAGARPTENNHVRRLIRRHGAVSQNSTAYGAQPLTSELPDQRHCDVEVDVVSRRTEASDEDLERSTSTSSAPAGVKALLHP